MKIAILVWLVVLTALCSGEDVAYTSKSEVENFNFYTFNAYRKLFDGSKNFVFSPFSLRVIYNMLFQSATGGAEKSLKTVLFQEASQPGLKQSVIQGQSENLNSIWTSPNIKLANKVYLRDGSELTDNFSEIVTKYHSEFQYVDFSEGAEVANSMNHWVENKTNGLITNLVDPKTVDPLTQLFAINTVYFKADWISPFTKEEVQIGAFKSGDGTTRNVDFIDNSDYYSLAQFDDLNVDVLEILYNEKSGFAFWIILPRNNSNLLTLSGQLNNAFFKRIGKSLTPHFVHIKFPVFTIQSEVDGKKISPESFASSEFDVIKGFGGLAVDEIKQKAKIIVNTQGTEASAATYVKIFFLSADPEPDEIKEFVADHPFVFAVVSRPLAQPIFVGHYVQAD